METCDIGIIGGGAAGLMAAIAAAENGAQSVTVFESNVRCGTKILMSGGSRCNVTNKSVSASDFHGGSRNVIKNILRSFTETDTLNFFKRLGVELKEEGNGKIFPVDNKATTILNALIRRCNQLNINIRLQTKITSVEKNADLYLLRSGSENFSCRKVILTTGGKSYPSTGSDGTGYGFAARFGHTVIEPFPALTPILLNEPEFCALSGITIPATLSLFHHDKKLPDISGSTLITHFGLSGPAALNISREIERLNNDITLKINFIPELNYEKLSVLLKSAKNDHPEKNVISIFREFLPAALNKFIFDKSGISSETRFNTLRKDQIKELCRNYTEHTLRCAGVKGFKQAEVTAGGVPLDEIKYQTMESKKQAGLYLAGEILDADGLIGGYNFQWAWSTGYIAGRASVIY